MKNTLVSLHRSYAGMLTFYAGERNSIYPRVAPASGAARGRCLCCATGGRRAATRLRLKPVWRSNAARVARHARLSPRIPAAGAMPARYRLIPARLWETPP
jgi:hypothetical protein